MHWKFPSVLMFILGMHQYYFWILQNSKICILELCALIASVTVMQTHKKSCKFYTQTALIIAKVAAYLTSRVTLHIRACSSNTDIIKSLFVSLRNNAIWNLLHNLAFFPLGRLAPPLTLLQYVCVYSVYVCVCMHMCTLPEVSTHLWP